MNTREKMNSGGYDHKLPYPSIPIRSTNVPHHRMAIDNPEFKAARNAWREEGHQITQQFKADLEEEFGTQNWDRKEQAWNLAWQEGHSGGFAEVLNYYIDYVEAFFK